MNVYIPENEVLEEGDVYLNQNELADLLRKYKDTPEAVQFIADMLEE